MKQLLILPLLIFIFCSCRSAENAFNDGRQAEYAGNNRNAARFYMEAIRLKPETDAALKALERVGQRVIDKDIKDAIKFSTQKRPLSYLKSLKTGERQYRQMTAYSQTFILPGNFDHLLKDAKNKCVIHFFNEAKIAENKKQWDKSLQILTGIYDYEPNPQQQHDIKNSTERVKNLAFTQIKNQANTLFKQEKWPQSLQTLNLAAKYSDNPAKEELLNKIRQEYLRQIILTSAMRVKTELDINNFLGAGIHLSSLNNMDSFFSQSHKDSIRLLYSKINNKWAAHLFHKDQYRLAWHKASEVFQYDAENAQARALQKKAMQLGRTSFVVLPIIHSNESKNLALECVTSFNNGPARNMPPLCGLTSDFALRNAIRLLRITPQRMTRNNAMRIAQRTDAQYIVFRELTDHRNKEQEISHHSETVKRKDGTTTKINITKNVLTVSATMRYTLIDAETA
ncbi:MAG: hypothetical protein HRT88_22560, partial [Lentisphaeraceae bacterium]|nr:hypothetical protein [Lentisphaeraceae bacterium]